MSFNLSCTAQELNASIAKANAAAPQSTTYTKAQTDTLLDGKANADAIAAIKDGTNIDSFADVETALADKADKSTTYTKGQVDTTLATKLNKSDVDTSLSSTSTNPVQNKAVQAPIARLVDVGAKNLLNITATSQTINGITFSVNNDGTFTANGTATGGNAILDVAVVDCDTTGTVLSGCPAGGYDGVAKYALYVRGVGFSDYGDSSFLNENVIGRTIACAIYDGNTVNNLTFKPMICTAEDWAVSHKFAQYAPTNRELYEMILAMQNGGNG